MAEMPKIVVLTDDELTALIDSSVTKAIAPLSAAIAKINVGTPATTPGQQTGGETGGNGTQSPVDTGSAPGQQTAGIVLEVVSNDPRGQIRIVADAKVVQGSKIRLANSQAFNVVGSDTKLISLDQKIGNVAAVTGKAYEIISTPVKSETQTPSAPVETAPTPAPAPSTGTAPKLINIPLVGVNLAAHPNASQVQPGEAGTHFKWFSKKDVDYWVGEQGVRLIRWPYELQRSMVAETSTGLPSKTGQLDSTFVAKVKERYEWIRAASKGEAKIIFDPHHYWRIWRNQTSGGKQTGVLLTASQAAGQGGRWKAQERILIEDGNGWGPKELGLHLVNFIKELDDPMVIGYGTGNEPYPSAGGLDGIAVQVMEKRIVDYHNIILPMMHEVTDKPGFVCGNHWASARMWAQVSGSFVDQIKDKNVIFEWHGYGDLDNSSSGQYSNVSTFPADQLVKVFSPAFQYHAAKGTRGFTGETGIPPTDSGRAMLQEALKAHEAAGVPMTLWVAGGDGAMNGEKMYLDTADHAKTREMLKPWFKKTLAEWTAVRG